MRVGFKALFSEIKSAGGDRSWRPSPPRCAPWLPQFPALESGCTPEQRQTMGQRLLTVEKTAPTYPHPATAGQRSAMFLDSVGQFMVTNSTVITVFVLLLLGASVLGDGLSGLGR
ncbi:hypothetical protein ACWDCC_39605 [Streptomyces sp. NPDC001102]